MTKNKSALEEKMQNYPTEEDLQTVGEWAKQFSLEILHRKLTDLNMQIARYLDLAKEDQ